MNKNNYEQNLTAKTIPTIEHIKRMIRIVPPIIINARRKVWSGRGVAVGDGFVINFFGGSDIFGSSRLGASLNQLSTD